MRISAIDAYSTYLFHQGQLPSVWRPFNQLETKIQRPLLRLGAPCPGGQRGGGL